MDDMSLQELLDSVGINKKQLANLMGCTPKTIQRLGDKVSDEVLACIERYKEEMTHEQSEEVPTPIPVSEPTRDPVGIQPVSHRNIALSRIKYGREGWPIDDVARLFGLSVAAYNLAVQDTIIYCQDKGTSFMELRGEID